MLYTRDGCMAEWRVGWLEPVFIPGIFFWGGDKFPPKNFTIPQTAAKLCALNLFFGPGQ